MPFFFLGSKFPVATNTGSWKFIPRAVFHLHEYGCHLDFFDISSQMSPVELLQYHKSCYFLMNGIGTEKRMYLCSSFRPINAYRFRAGINEGIRQILNNKNSFNVDLITHVSKSHFLMNF